MFSSTARNLNVNALSVILNGQFYQYKVVLNKKWQIPNFDP